MVSRPASGALLRVTKGRDLAPFSNRRGGASDGELVEES